MLNFDYHNPTHILFGKNRIAELDLLIEPGVKVLILYGGRSAKKHGTIAIVKAALGSRTTIEFSGIEPNPSYKTLIKAVEVVKTKNIDFLLAIGGGSVMDGTKFVALAANYEGEASDLLKPGFARKVQFNKVHPIGTIATLPATGSEMNPYGVISFNNAKYSFTHKASYPKFSILDPTLSFSLPKKQVANGVVDAFVHVIEQYVTYPVNSPFQDRTAEGLLKTLIEIGKKTIEQPNNYEARSSLMWCATNALNGLIGAGVPQDWSTHMIGHELTALFGIDHAQSLAIVLPSLWEVRKDKKRVKLLQYARRVWDIQMDDDKAINLAIQNTRNFFEDLGLKTQLSAYGIKREDISKVLNALKANGMTKLSESNDLTIEVSKKILEKAF